ncbi:MAG: histidinol-phosphate transaminase [Propionibacteriaceae bacterium]|jgi:histidinol-phosphate aminotransferase|nr:histidinol-phosphate transaminase [Propionibacteriaceae bacterium]
MRANPSLGDLPLRPELAGEEPYGAPQLDVPVRLNVNENPYPPSVDVLADMAIATARLGKGVHRYPDREATALRAALAGYLNSQLEAAGLASAAVLGAEHIWAANGSNEVMLHLCQAFAGPSRRVLAFTPTYSMYPQYARDSHSRYLTAPRLADFTVDPLIARAAIATYRPSLAVIASPNNPTGTSTPLSSIRRILSDIEEIGVDTILVVDEAYQEFSRHPDNTALQLLGEYGNLVVVRTMSKAFAFAGGRVGYLAAAPAIVDACRIVRLPYHLSAQTQALAQVALAHADEMLSRVAELRETRDSMIERLSQLGLEVIDSDANFCLFGPFSDRHDVWQRLLDRGVLVREVGPEGFLRVCAGTPAETDAFVAAIAAVLEEL